MKKKITSFLLVIVLCISVLAPMGTAKAATVIAYDDFSISESEVYSFRNVASGWYMNVRNAGKSNGTQINLYPLDMSEPVSQRYVFHVVDANKKIVQISPQSATKRYLDVRRNGRGFASGQGICIWEADGDPIKNLVLEFQEDGSFYLSFEKYPEYCIGAKSLVAASTMQTQLVVCKKTGAPEQLWRLCDKNGLSVNDIENTKESWNNPYYEKHGQDYIDLFNRYPAYLTNDAFDDVTQMYFESCNQVLEKNKKNTGIGAYLYALDHGKDVIVCEVLSKFGLSKSFGEKIRFDSVQLLMQDICGDKYTLTAVMSQVEENFAQVEESYSLANAVSKTKYINDIAKATGISKGAIEKIVDEAYRNEDKIEKKMENKVDIVSYVTTVFQLNSLDQKMIDYMMKSISTESDLYRDLLLLKDNTGNNTYKYIMDKFFSEKAQDIVGDVLVKSLGKGKKSFELATVVAEAGVSLLVNHVYQGALGDEIAQTTYLYSYAMVLQSAIVNMRVKFLEEGHVVTAEEIGQYEFLMSAYLSALKTMLQSAQEMESSKIGKSNIQNLIESLDDWFDYDAYVTLCIKQLPRTQSRLDELVEQLNGKYFTVNQKACASTRYSGHGCTNCNVGTIINTAWFKNKFGTVNTSLFPYHDVNASRRDHAGQSCFGFACFAQWFVYANSNIDKVTAERVATIKFNKTDLQAKVQPGDVLRVNGHSMLVYAVEEKGLRVVDSNWNMGGQLNCLVQKHLVTYDNTWCAGYTTYVNRVTEVEGKSNGNAIADKATGQIGYLDLSKVGWSAYNVGTDVEMGADKAYTIYPGAKLKILGTYINSKGNKIYHVYSESLKMNCYVSAKYVSVGVAPVATLAPKPTATPTPKATATPKSTVTPKPTVTSKLIVTPKPTVTPKPKVTPKPTATPIPTATPTVTPKPTVTPTPVVTKAPEKSYGYLDLSALGWSAYNVGMDVEMNASKAYTIYQGSKFEILGKYTNSKGNQIYHVYSESLGMKCYVSARVVKLGEAPKKVYGTLDLKAVGWKAYNAGTDVELNADRAYTIYDGAQLEILGTYTNSKGNKIYHVYSSDLKIKCYVAARLVDVNE